jgi:hypothetical protein
MSHKDMLQLIDFERFLFDHMIPCDQDALYVSAPARTHVTVVL